MAYTTHKDTETGHLVEAIQAGHSGILLPENSDFKESDFIVLFPIDLLGQKKRMVFAEEVFRVRFGVKKTVDWKALGWLV